MLLRQSPTGHANHDPNAKIGCAQDFAYQKHGPTEYPKSAPILLARIARTQISVVVRDDANLWRGEADRVGWNPSPG